MPIKNHHISEGVSEPVRIACVDHENAVFHQLKEAFDGESIDLIRASNIDRVVELVEHAVLDVLVVISASVRDVWSEWREFIEILSAASPWTQVIFLIKPREIALAAKALRAGSFHYAKLPISNEEMRLLIEAALASRPNIDPTLHYWGNRRHTGFNDMVGTSASMKKVYRLIRQAAATDIPVLLTGETGVGKDLAARAIHQLSERSEHVFMPVHLGALPADLVASELFGHEKGAFTGATEARQGSFELAHRGTVFLDEISTIDDRVQISLLRLLETKAFHRIGGRDVIKVDVRLIAASNENLEEAVERGRFRDDLYYRLEVFQIEMPPLRERSGDLPLLVDEFLKRYNKEYQKNVLGLSPEAVALLEAYAWPGNVRELKNVIHRAVVVCSGEVITPEHLSTRIKNSGGASRRIVLPVGITFDEAEKILLEQTLEAAGKNRSLAADILGVSRGTLYNKMKKYRLG